MQSSGKTWKIKLISLHPTEWYRRRGREGSQVYGLYSRSLWIWSGTLACSNRKSINTSVTLTVIVVGKKSWPSAESSLHHPHPSPSSTPKSLPLQKLERQSGWRRPEQHQGQAVPGWNAVCQHLSTEGRSSEHASLYRTYRSGQLSWNI